MECPYCAEDLKDEAIVCQHCSRDLRLVLPIMEENAAALAEMDRLQHEINAIERRLERRAAPLRFWLRHAAQFILPPIVLILIAHYVIIIQLDKTELYLRLAAMVIPLPFGFALMWAAVPGALAIAIAALVVGLGGVAAMMGSVSLIDKVAFLPQTARDLRDALDFSASIAFAFAAGAVLAVVVRRMLPDTMNTGDQPNALALRAARVIGPHVGHQALRRRARRIQDLMDKVGPAAGLAATVVGAAYAGLKSFLGM